MKSGFLASLRNQGYSVKVRHVRNFWNTAAVSGNEAVQQMTRGEFARKNNVSVKNHIQCKGGRTEVTAIAPTGEEFHGVASCHPSDNYNRSAGIELALKKAFNSKKKNLPIDTVSTFQVLVFT